MDKEKNEKLIKKRLKELSIEIQKHNHSYHNLDKPKITDSEYDKLLKENNDLEKNYPHLILDDGPNKFVGSKVKSKFEKIKHLSQMYSLSNAFNKEDVLEFIKRMSKFLNISETRNFDFLVEPKIDGLSLNLFYKKGKLVSAATRGDGLIGENVTENIKKIRDIPIYLNNEYPDFVEIRGEVFINRDDFNTINSMLKNKEKFANPRNAAAGS